MATDFIRIGGEIVSAPLNENFRRLRNDISVATANLVFSDTDGIKNTLEDMLAIENPDNAQVCYVVSSGEMYRYTAGDGQWHKIMDFGQTFRQGFLNSGAVVLEDSIKLKTGSKTVLIMPEMLVYFKSKEGDAKYLKGMYQIAGKEFDLQGQVNGGNAYSILVDFEGNYSVMSGMPVIDNPEKVFIGTVLVNGDNEILEQFVYTLPDMAYTADRSHFFLMGGTAEGGNLTTAGTGNGQVTRSSGFYYDEGINYPQGKTENFPIDTDNGSNFNLKAFEGMSPVPVLYYMTPSNSLSNPIDKSTTGLIIDKYWKDNKTLVSVPKDHFTIQQHLITPNGQNIILYGKEIYSSMKDAIAALNSVNGIDVNFPYIEATRLVVGNTEDKFDSGNETMCQFFTLTNVSRIGTIGTEFADNLFKIHSGDDTTPVSVRFSLKDLSSAEFDNLYTLTIEASEAARKLFYNNEKYTVDKKTVPVQDSITNDRVYDGLPGYKLADAADLEYLSNRIGDIEKEIWHKYDDTKAIYEQSIRHRLSELEATVVDHKEDIDKHGTRLTALETSRVNKGTTINGYKLGDTESETETKTFNIQTGDIQEGVGNATSTNLWYTEERVSKNTSVAAATAHLETKSKTDDATQHVVVNPHALSTDDLNVLDNTTRLFVTPEEERRIRADKLPDDTIKALADLDAKNMDSIKIDTIDGTSETTTGKITQLGNVTDIRFYEYGVGLELSEDGKTLTVECLGQADADSVMMRKTYATKEMADPTNPELKYTVDKAVTAIAANAIHGIASAGADKYYGTDKDGNPGIHSIQKFVTTASADAFTSIDQVAFVPINGSVVEEHLSTDLANKINNNYHEIYNTGTLKSAQINKFNFGDNLTVTVNGDTATINATGELSGVGVLNFANLADVEVTYTGNKGRMLVVNEDENGVTTSDALSLDEYMLETVYVDPDDVTKVRKARQADNATLAATATNAVAVNNKSVDDTKTSNAYLWTAEKIIANTSSQITNEGVTTHSGTVVPSDSLGKNGDLYILIED